jgi:hypothetical protein
VIRTVRQGADFTEILIKEGQYPLGIAFNLKLFDFPIFQFEAYLMKVIPVIRCTH